MANTTALRVGFLGAGQMATSLAHGWVKAGLVAADHIFASDPSEHARHTFHKLAGGHVTADNRAVVAHADLLVLAVKPQVLPTLLSEVKLTVTPKHLVVSIAAGTPLRVLAEALGHDRRLVRVMPNTACIVSASAAGYSPGDKATAEDVALVDKLLNAIGKAYRLPESLLDAVTGLSGSGPAFVYVMIEALSDGGVRMGLPRDVATGLAAQTLLGAARMVLETEHHPGELKDMVTSPGGTTIAGLHALERGGVRAALMDAVEAATKRAQELGRV